MCLEQFDYVLYEKNNIEWRHNELDCVTVDGRISRTKASNAEMFPFDDVIMNGTIPGTQGHALAHAT